MAVSGTGGDELFAGYPWFIDMAAYGNAPHSPFQTVLAQALRQPALDLLLRGKPGRLVHKVHSQGDFVSRYAELYQIFGAAGARQLNPARAARGCPGGTRALLRSAAPG